MPSLTKRQKQIYDFIVGYISENGISPTIEETRKKFKLHAISTAHQHIKSLIEKGFLEKDFGSSRGVVKTNGMDTIIQIPILGKIAAGKPIEAIVSGDESISVASGPIKSAKDHYALRVVGDSMINEGIFDGDIVVIKKQSSAENGQTVVAIIDDNHATLKMLYKEKNKFRLQPANQSLLPIFRKEVEIRGVVIQVIRNITKHEESPQRGARSHKFRTIDLFAGVGGIRLGFERAGFKTVFANDFEKNCKQTYDLNFKSSKLIVEDIRKIKVDDLPEFDFLLGGFPCQAFSIAGHRKGFDDERGRGNLFFDIAHILDKRKPEGFLLENVKNLRTHDEGRTFKIISETLQDLGYHIKVKVLNSMEYGNTPQNRERIYIVGFKNKAYFDKFDFPNPVKLTKKITDLLEKDVSEKYYYNNKPLFAKLKNFVKEIGKVYQWRRQYVRENKKNVCPTLTANMGMGGHNVPIIKDRKGIRKLTPIECARIQGFPTDYVLPAIADSALYKQFGNSVTVTVLEAIAKRMMSAMQN